MHRNAELHTSVDAQLQIIEADINRRIKEALQNGSRCLPCNALLMLQLPKEQALRWPLATKQQGLDSLEVA